MFPESGSTCIVGAPGGTAYILAPATGANGIPWLQAPGSKDLNAAAAHFVVAGIAAGCDGGSGNLTCISSTDSRLTGISSAALAHVPNFFIRNDDNTRLHLGDSLAEQICYLFTGSYNIPCSYLSVTHGPITAFPGFTTSTTSVNQSWGMYTGGDNAGTSIDDAEVGNDFQHDPFDSLLYYRFNSQFVSGLTSIQPPCSTQSVPTVAAPNNLYLCNTSYDLLSNQMEYAPCLSATGDPAVGSSSNLPTSPGNGICPNSSQLSAASAGIQTENAFGSAEYTIPIITMLDQYGYYNNYSPPGNGWVRVVNAVNGGVPNYFTFLNAYNNASISSGALTIGLSETTSTLNPFDASTFWDGLVGGNIYDSLTTTDPLSGDLIDWMILSAASLTNSSLTYLPPKGTTSTFRFTLRSDMFFQDGEKVTAFDVAFSYLNLKAVGAFSASGAAPMTGVTVLGPSQIDINLNRSGPFTSTEITGLPIIPGSFWSNQTAKGWRSDIATCTATGAACYPAQYTIASTSPPKMSCVLTCVFSAADMNVAQAQTGPNYDPIKSGTLIGSGGWQCGTGQLTTTSGSCSSSGAQNPPQGGSYVLTRFGKGLAPGSSFSAMYFRSSSNLALYLWSQDNGDITHDFLNFSVVASCFTAPVTSSAPCAHFQEGIGGLTRYAWSGNGNNFGAPQPVGLSQVSIVNRFVGLNWVAPFNWAANPPLGIIPVDPVLYEGATIISPSSSIGCPNGYEC